MIRADLASIPPYVAGRSAPGAIKLASNETTAGPLPTVAQAIAAAAADANRYPDITVSALRDALAEFLGTDPERVGVGCGSVALCQEIVQIMCGTDDDEVLFAWRAFEAYPLVTRVARATAVTVPLTPGLVHDLDGLAAAVTDRTKVVIVCNPNNPTGTAVGRAALTRFLDAIPPHVLVVLDEAYFEYVRLPGDQPDGVELGRERPNVLVLRTFSKAYGMAGLRVGYAVGAPEIITALAAVRIPFSVNRVAQAGALAALSCRDELLARTGLAIAERERVRGELLAAGFTVPPSQANFVWLPLGTQTTAFAAASAASGIIVRPFAGDGVRVTIGDRHENDAFLQFATGPGTVTSFTAAQPAGNTH